MQKPLVSILIPYYNDKAYLPIAIESVLNNNYEDYELILVNHATTDNCREIAHTYTDSRIKHIDMPCNYGYGGTGLILKEFLKLAKGKYVKLLCADDILKPDGLESLVDFMESNPHIDFAFGDVEYVDKKGKSLKNSWFDSRKNFDIKDREAECIRKYSNGQSILPYIGSIIKRECLSDITINTTFIMMFDMALWLSLLCAGYKIGFLNKYVCDYRIHSRQASSPEHEIKAKCFSKFEGSAFWKILLNMKDINLVRAVWHDSKYAEKLNNPEDIPFFIAQALLEFKTPYFMAYEFLTELLNNDAQREHINNTFDYGVRNLRLSCVAKLEEVDEKHNEFNKYKMHTYFKRNKDLSVFDLAFLFLRKIFNAVTLKPIIRYFKDKDRNL